MDNADNEDHPAAQLTIRVAVGSKNPCKIEAVKKAFEDVFGRRSRPVQILISSHTVPSGVSDQPFGDAETREGATNRAKAAYDAEKNENNQHLDFAVGLEGGLEKLSDELWCMAWMAIYGGSKSISRAFKTGDMNKQSWGYAKTGCFLLPPALYELVLKHNMELGDADDKVFSRVNSKHGEGTVGKLTDGEINRAEYYVHALKLALIPWIRPELYLT